MATTAQISSFILMIAPLIQAECKARGYAYPSAIIAQACCESAYGTSQLGYKYHNYFGMKCGSSWKGKSVNMKTKEEYTVGTLTTISDNFRVYDSAADGVSGYFVFISKPRYNNLKDAKSSRNYIELLKADGYATSSTYVNTVYGIVEKYNLTQYDDIQSEPETPQIKPVDLEVVRKVLAGEYGNGASRQVNVTADGYSFIDVQKKVNEICTIADTIKPLKKELGDFWELVDLLV